MNLKRTAAFVTIGLIWGSAWLVQQTLQTPGDQLQFSALSYGFSAVVLGIIGLIFRLPRPRIKECGYCVILGVTLVSLPYLLSLYASPHVSSSLAIIVLSLTPLVATFLLDAPWSARNAAIAGTAGVVLVVADTASTSSRQLGGVGLLLIGVAAVAISLVLAKKYLSQIHPVFMSSMLLAVAAIILGLTGIFESGRTATAFQTVPWMQLAWVCAGNSIAYVLYFWLLKRIRPDQLASIIWLQFLVSLAEGALLFHPRIQLQMLAGILVVAGGLIALARSKTENKMLTVGVTLRPR